MTRSTLVLHLCALAVALLITACAESPTGRNQLLLVSEEQMAAMGDQAFQQMKQEKPRVDNATTSEYVNCVARTITGAISSSYNWEVAVFEDDAVNAFALPGGNIGVFTGLLKVTKNQHQLAAVIGHEVAHVIARHSAARVSSQLATELGVSILAAGTGMDPRLIGTGADLLLSLPYSRGDETEADRLGLQYMARAGFDPRESVDLWRNMAQEGGARPPEFLSTHPSPGSRIRDLQEYMPSAVQTYQQARAAGRRPQCVP
jgi:predicted Zn-dependent protease